jgi:energy-coupling factor transporter ATP-binding protein EcfA2
VDKKAITIAFDADMGEVIEEAVIQDSSFFLLEKLNSKLENIKSGQLTINIDGSRKLFGFSQPNSLAPMPLNEQRLADFYPNCEQEIAIRKALSQEVTFIWGPPGTGKTKTLALILGLLSASGKKILLTANTNAAVDEMLKKFLDDKQNLCLAEQGKVIRLGVPTFEDEKIALLMPKNILQKRTGQSNEVIVIIQKEIEKDQQKIVELERQEKEIRDRQVLLKELDDELLRTQNKIETLRNTLTSAKNNRDQLFNQLSASRKKLENAEKASVIKRIFSGTNKEKIKEDIKHFENKHKIAQLEVLSIEKEFY